MSLPRLARHRSLSTALHPHNHPIIRSYFPLLRRHASNETPEPNASNLRPLVLEQPDKFRPPSHGARRVTRKHRNFGPALSDEEVKAQKTKKYPHMMPPEGTVAHKFLTDRSIHVWISMSVLVSMAGFVLLTDFKTKNKYPEMLPPSSLFFSSPINFISQYFAVYKLHQEAVNAENHEKRAKQIDEARKRKEYLIAHGVDKEGFLGFGTVEGDERKAKREREAAAAQLEKVKLLEEVTKERYARVEASVREGSVSPQVAGEVIGVGQDAGLGDIVEQKRPAKNG